MYVKVRNAMTGEQVMVTASKLTTVSEVKEEIMKKMKVGHQSQKLFFMGKELEDNFSLFDYSVKVNDLIQLFVRQPLAEHKSQNVPESSAVEKQTKLVKSSEDQENDLKVEEAESEHIKVKEEVDCRDEEGGTGAWFEAVVERITANDEAAGADGLTYHVKYEGYDRVYKVRLDQLRPRARRVIPFLDLDLKMEVMVNYNIDNPEERGFWYDAVVTAWRSTSSKKVLEVSILGPAGQQTKNCQVQFRDEVMAVEKVTYATRPASGRATASVSAAGGDKCTCKGKKNVACRKCGCRKCAGREDDASMILCDECDAAYHPKCVGFISVSSDPDQEWYCPDCKNDNDIVGGKIKMTKKKTGEGRDWGRGFACQGRTKECNKVKKNHFGPIPGIEVGMSWFRRIQVSEEGVHRPPVGGIAGTEKEGCQSLVLAGGYEDDEDNGDSFTYTGSGGRDLSGNKRTAGQSSDQLLTKFNAAIARNCKASFNDKVGGDAGDNWKEGKPIRVVRNYKGKKHSQFAPEDGNRYDGLYKVVKYWPGKGKSGFRVWRYLLRRDDPSPPPWTKEGERRIEEEGYTMIYPEGYLEHQAMMDQEKKRKSGSGDEEEEEEKENNPKKKARTIFKISTEWQKLIKKDSKNCKNWEQVISREVANKKEFTDYVEELFNCIICQEIVYKPSTPCLAQLLHGMSRT